MSVANLEAYALTKGMKKAYDQMTEVEKVQLRYGYIMEQTADAQGDFARTQDGFANQVRLLQNNLDTMAANIGAMLIPTLTEAVGWVNELFAGSETNATQAAIDDAIGGLETLEQDIQTIKNNYAQESIKIRLEYEEAQGLIDELKTLQEGAGFGTRTLRLGMKGEDVTALQVQLEALGYAIDTINEEGVFGESTQTALKQYQTDMGLAADGIAGVKTYAALLTDHTEKLKTVTAELVALYPQLAEYVGKDGVLMLEGDQVDGLCQKYRSLQYEKLMASRVEQMGGEYVDALFNMAMLEEKKAEAEEELRRLNEKGNAMVMSRDKAVSALQRDAGIAETLSVIDAYIDAYGNLDDELAFMNSRRDKKDGSKLFDGQGNLKSAAEIESMEGGEELLRSLLNAIVSANSDERFEVYEQIEAAEKAVQTAEEAIEEYKPTLEAIQEEYELAKDIYKDFVTGGENAGKDSVKAMRDAMEAQDAEVNAAVRELALSGQKEANANPITIPVQVQSAEQENESSGTFARAVPGHATGLSYVPYDGYLARLHVGERVLTAAEAREYGRSGGAGIDYDALAAAVRRANVGTNTQPIQLVIDGRVMAQTLAEQNRTAIGGREKRIGAGVGR